MYLRYDGITRTQYLDSQFVYTLVVDTNGIYIAQTGSQNRSARLATDEVYRLSQIDEHSAYVPFDDVLSVVARARIEEHAMFLKTRQGDFSFQFTSHSTEQIYELVQAISENKPS
jgi:hypothetical protein